MTPSLQLRHVALRVADLTRSLEFYIDQVGFAIAERSGKRVDLAIKPGAGAILSLLEAPRAPQPPRDTAGLFHSALLFPNRAALGGWLRVAAERRIEFAGFSDHAVSEAVYFSDPDGNGLEFYADRPRESWPLSGTEVEMVTRPLDLPSLLGAAAPPSPAPLADANWGHLHLRVSNLDQSERFYIEALGVIVTQRSYPGARFLAADGYHHHLGLNSWGGVRHPLPARALGLIEATFARRGITVERQLTDPDGISVRITPS